MVKIWEFLERLTERIYQGIAAPIVDLREWADATLSDKLRFGILDTIEDIEAEAVKMANPLIDLVLENKSIPPAIRKYFTSLKTQFAPIQLVALAPFIIGAVLWAMAGAFAGWGAQVRQESMRVFKPTLLSPTDTILAKWRGKFSVDRANDEFAQMGYNPERIEALEEINKFLPGVQDLIRFTVRDVFREEIVKNYKYDEGFKEIEQSLKPWATKLGMEPDTLKLYWRAHWDLPSLTSAYEMFHRGFLSQKELEELIKINDMAPHYVDKLIKIAYAPYTRVDIRRMFDYGILNREQVKKAYKDIGYDEEHAENLTKFTEKEVLQRDLDLSKTEIVSLYNSGTLNKPDAIKNLLKLGYDSQESELVLKLEEVKAEQKLKDRDKKVISNLYYYGKITRPEAEKQLNTLNLSEREKVLTLSEVEARIREKHKNPTKADLEQWFKKGLIGQSEFIAEMLTLGYSEKHISNYLTLLLQE
jgi:hypothetical protein